MTREEKAKRNELIKQDRLNGMSMHECSEKYGLKNITHICKQMGVDGKLSQNKCDYSKVSEKLKGPKKSGAEYLQKYGVTDFVCTGLFEGCDGKIGLRCVKCGYEFEYSAQGIRHNKKTRCKKCLEIKAEARKKEAEQARMDAKEQRDILKEQKAIQQAIDREARKRYVVCDVCGKQFATYKLNTKRCSPQCSRKHNNAAATHRKDHRISKDKRIDNITLASLYERDGGVCYICGEVCRYDVDGNDNMYPSIDHVIPIAKGGTDSWDNVRLAHRICNSIKGSRPLLD